MIYTKYDSSGEFLFSVADNGDYDLPDMCIAGTYSADENYFDLVQQQVVPKPLQPSDQHVWDPVNKTWVLDLNLLTATERNHRNALLSQVDRVNPIWYNSLTTQQQTELQTYRQALLDVPQQALFPTQIVWPIKPDWL